MDSYDVNEIHGYDEAGSEDYGDWGALRSDGDEEWNADTKEMLMQSCKA